MTIMENRMHGEGKIVIHRLAALKSTRISPYLLGVMDFRIPALQKLLARSGSAKLIARGIADARLGKTNNPSNRSCSQKFTKTPMKRKSSASLFSLVGFMLSSAAATCATIITENFESGATGWNLNASPGTSTTTIASVDLGLGDGPSNVLRIATGSSYQVGETPSINLTGATTATITFDYGDTNGGGTRFMSVDFWTGSTWVQLGSNITHNAANGTISLNVTSGFGADNKFRFEGKNAGGGGTQYSYIDNVIITADVVPEPRAALLGGLGLLALLRRRR